MSDQDATRATRRAFLISTGAAATGVVAAAGVPQGSGPRETPALPVHSRPVPDAPPADTPAITRESVEGAERVTGVLYTDEERDQLVASLGEQIEEDLASVMTQESQPHEAQPEKPPE